MSVLTQILKAVLLNKYTIKIMGLSALMQNHLKEKEAFRKKVDARKQTLKELGFKEMSKEERHKRVHLWLRARTGDMFTS